MVGFEPPKDLPELRGRVKAVRSALRAFPGLSNLFQGYGRGSERDQVAAELIAAVRGILVSWTSVAFTGVDGTAIDGAHAHVEKAMIDFDARRRDLDWPGSSDYGRAAMETNVDAARRCLALVGRSVGLPDATPPADRDWTHIHPRETKAFFGPKAREHRQHWLDIQVQAENADHAALASGSTTVPSLAFAPLWNRRADEAFAETVWAREWYDTESFVWLSKDFLSWLRERTPGCLVLGEPPQGSAHRMVAIANLPSSFWEHGQIDDVPQAFYNAFREDIAGILWGLVGDARSRALRNRDADLGKTKRL